MPFEPAFPAHGQFCPEYPCFAQSGRRSMTTLINHLAESSGSPIHFVVGLVCQGMRLCVSRLAPQRGGVPCCWPCAMRPKSASKSSGRHSRRCGGRQERGVCLRGLRGGLPQQAAERAAQDQDEGHRPGQGRPSVPRGHTVAPPWGK